MFVSSLLPYIRECCFVGHLKSIIYYTDVHDVDENERTMASCSGHWNRVSSAGVMDRNLLDSLSRTVYDVASMCRHSRIIFTHYPDWHYVDESMMTIIVYGGEWVHTTWAGIAFRNMCNAPTEVWNTVASKKIIYLLPHGKEAY